MTVSKTYRSFQDIPRFISDGNYQRMSRGNTWMRILRDLWKNIS